MSPPVFSTSYFPSIEYLQACFQFEEIQIEHHEYYQKQTLRNRCFILSPNGVQCLTVPVQHTGRKKILIKDVKISYDEHWQRQHWRSLETAYNRSAFFEFYKDELENILMKKNKFLVDLNEKLLLWMMQKLKYHLSINHTNSFIEENLFQYLSDKKNNLVSDSKRELKSYPQVFTSKFGFVPNLSAIDLLFNMGTVAAKFISSVE